MLLPVLFLMSSVTSGKLTSLRLAFLAFQRGLDYMNLTGLGFREPRPGHMCLSIVHELSPESSSWPLGFFLVWRCTTFQAMSSISYTYWPGQIPLVSPACSTLSHLDLLSSEMSLNVMPLPSPLLWLSKSYSFFLDAEPHRTFSLVEPLILNSLFQLAMHLSDCLQILPEIHGGQDLCSIHSL